MPLKPEIKQRVIDIFKSRASSKTNPESKLRLSKSLARKLLESGTWVAENNVKLDVRNLFTYNGYFLDADIIPGKKYSLTRYIREKYLDNHKIPRILDVCAGEGNFGKDLEKQFGYSVKYKGIDLLKREHPKISVFDVTLDKLPKESFDIILNYFGFIYFPDKLSALENMINALKVGGIIQIYPGFELFVSRDSNTYFEINKSFFVQKMMHINPFLEVRFTDNESLLIFKKQRGIANIPFRYDGAKPKNLEKVARSMENNKLNGSFAMRSYYTYDPNKKSKW